MSKALCCRRYCCAYKISAVLRASSGRCVIVFKMKMINSVVIEMVHGSWYKNTKCTKFDMVKQSHIKYFVALASHSVKKIQISNKLA